MRRVRCREDSSEWMHRQWRFQKPEMGQPKIRKKKPLTSKPATPFQSQLDWLTMMIRKHVKDLYESGATKRRPYAEAAEALRQAADLLEDYPQPQKTIELTDGQV